MKQFRKGGDQKMKCELCKKNNVTQGMALATYDVNGVVKFQVCQQCLKKIKNGHRDTKPQDVEIRPAKVK